MENVIPSEVVDSSSVPGESNSLDFCFKNEWLGGLPWLLVLNFRVSVSKFVSSMPKLFS